MRFVFQPSLWRDFGFAVFSGVLLWFSWPNAFWPGVSTAPGWLAWFALAPLIVLWKRTGWRGNFIFAWIVGFVFFLGSIYWLRLINKDTNVDNTIGWFFFAACGGIYFGLFGMSSRIIHDRLKLPAWIVLPVVWTGWEYVRGHIITGGWPWGSLGHTQYANPLLRQLAAVSGVGGVSFWLIWMNLFVVWFFTQTREKFRTRVKRQIVPATGRPVLQRTRLQRFLTMGLGTVVVLFWAIMLGRLVSESIRFSRVEPIKKKVTVVQPNINTDQRWDDVYKSSVMSLMEELHARAARTKPDLIVWAESSFPSFLEYEPEKHWEDRLLTIIRSAGIPTVLTSNEYPRTHLLEGPEFRHYNSAFFIDGQGRILERYRKIKLVPGGEYIPWNWMKTFMQAVVREPIPVDFEPGDAYTVFQWGDLHFSTLICYEDQYEELAFRMAQGGADFFISLSNDRWAGKSAMSTQRIAMSVFLAIEHRAYLVKAGMTGPSLMIDPWGRISPPIATFQAGINPLEIQVRRFHPWISKFGNTFAFSCLVTMIILFFSAFLFRRHETSATEFA